MSLVACPACRSVVLSRDVTCPFCHGPMRTIASPGAIKTAIGTIAGAAVLASGIGCAYGAPCTRDNCPPEDSGKPDITVGDVDGGKKDAAVEASSDAPFDAPSDAMMDASSDSTAD